MTWRTIRSWPPPPSGIFTPTAAIPIPPHGWTPTGIRCTTAFLKCLRSWTPTPLTRWKAACCTSSAISLPIRRVRARRFQALRSRPNPGSEGLFRCCGQIMQGLLPRCAETGLVWFIPLLPGGYVPPAAAGYPKKIMEPMAQNRAPAAAGKTFLRSSVGMGVSAWSLRRTMPILMG